MATDGYVEYKPQDKDEYEDVNEGPAVLIQSSDDNAEYYNTASMVAQKHESDVNLDDENVYEDTNID